MAKAMSISVSKLSAAVEAAVKVAVEKHPKLKVDPGTPLAISYLIWGIPVPEAFAAASIRETQAFANEMASQLGKGLPGQQVEGALFAHGGHLIVGIPAPRDLMLER